MKFMMRLFSLLSVILLFTIIDAKAQENYEIQVYGSETVEKWHTMVELHSHYTIDGRKTI